MKSSSTGLDKKTVIVTGAGKGIGAALVGLLITRGARVVAVSRTQADLDALRSKAPLEDIGFVCGDVRDGDCIRAALELCMTRWGRIDGLVNNAGVRQRVPFLELDDTRWSEVMDTNLTACFRWMRAVTPQMLRQEHGTIVNVASIVGERGFAELCGYAAAKAGLLGLTQSYAVEFARAGIRANLVSPGFAESSYASSFAQRSPELHDWTLDQTPMGRWGTCEEVAEAIAFLLEDRASFITGARLACDGGWLAGANSPEKR